VDAPQLLSDPLIFPAKPTATILSGLSVATAVAILATLGAHAVPLVGAPVLAIVAGAAYRLWRPVPEALRSGIAFSSKTVLQSAIIVSGFGLSFVSVVRTGIATLPVTLATIAVALVLAPFAGRLLRINGVLSQLIGVGTAICGASAIAAVATVLEPADEEVTLSIATIFFYNIVAVLAFPPIGHLLHLTQAAFGVWAGTAINDTSSVVAAGYAYGHGAGAHATIVKLTRATFILPIVGFMAALRARASAAAGARVPWSRIVPWFIVWFLCAALVNTTGIVPADWHGGIADGATFLISIALAAIGLQTDLRRLVSTGFRPLALGFTLWLAVAFTSLLVQRAAGT
jgi:uncharacterized integral membrane protein (TIGR00698 family)